MDDLSKFSEVLDSLMFERELNATQLAMAVGTDPTNIMRYLRCTRTPSVETLVKLADYFGCTTDYLLGRESENYPTTFYPLPPFSEQLKVLKEHFKCPWWQIYKTAHITSSRFYEWKNGTFSPKLVNIILLADGFGCTVDFIIGRTKM